MPPITRQAEPPRLPEPWTLARLMYVYFDPAKLPFPFDADITGVRMAPKLFFEDTRLLGTALKLKRSLESSTSEHPLYLEALAIVLAHELISFHRGTNPSGGAARQAGRACRNCPHRRVELWLARKEANSELPLL